MVTCFKSNMLANCALVHFNWTLLNVIILAHFKVTNKNCNLFYMLNTCALHLDRVELTTYAVFINKCFT